MNSQAMIRKKLDPKKYNTDFFKSLAKKLTSPFRYGASAFRYGLIPQGPSDHLPISMSISQSESSLQIISWNLLSDVHLYNSFLNITGNTILFNDLNKHYPEGNIYFNEKRNNLFYFFSEISQYLFKQSSDNTININTDILKKFTDSTDEPSALKFSAESVKQSRKQIINFMIQAFDKRSGNAHEYELAIRHAMEIIYHIKSEQGALSWKNRFSLIRNNKKLVELIASQDFICLQECTSPEDINNLLQEKNKSYSSISYRVNAHTQDYGVIFYNANKFKLLNHINYALENKKPCIFAKFLNLKTQEEFIVASIHHPGGKQNFLTEFEKNIAELQNKENFLPFYMLGDFNHEQGFFNEELKHFNWNVLSSDYGTMAGNDYENLNKTIDFIVTNQSKQKLQCKIVSALKLSSRAECPLNVIVEKHKITKNPFIFYTVLNSENRVKNKLVIKRANIKLDRISN